MVHNWIKLAWMQTKRKMVAWLADPPDGVILVRGPTPHPTGRPAGTQYRLRRPATCGTGIHIQMSSIGKMVFNISSSRTELEYQGGVRDAPLRD